MYTITHHITTLSKKNETIPKMKFSENFPNYHLCGKAPFDTNKEQWQKGFPLKKQGFQHKYYYLDDINVKKKDKPKITAHPTVIH